MFCKSCHKRIAQCKCRDRQLLNTLLQPRRRALLPRTRQPVRLRCKKCGHQEVTAQKIRCPKCRGKMENWEEAVKAFEKKVRDRKQREAATTIQRAFRLTRATQATLLGERSTNTPITEQRQQQLIKVDKHYLSSLYGLRLIASMTGRDHESDLWIGHSASTSYLRDAYEKIWGSLRGANKLFTDVIEKLRGKKGLVDSGFNFWVVNSPHAVERLKCLRLGSKPVLAAPPTIVKEEDGLYLISYKLSTGSFPKPWDTETSVGAADIFKEYLKFVGATPSSYHMFKFLNGQKTKKGTGFALPLLDTTGKVRNTQRLQEILKSTEFQKLKRLARDAKRMRPVYAASVKLIEGLAHFATKGPFAKGLLVQSALEGLYNVVKVMAFYDTRTERIRKAYDLLLDELFLILAAAHPYKPGELTDREQDIQDGRMPTLQAILQARPSLHRIIHPAWSGMDALTTALETAIAQSGADIQLVGEGDQATYFEVGCILAAQGRLTVKSLHEAHGSDEFDDSVTYPGVLMATMNPSSPEQAGPTALQVAQVAWKRANRLRRPVTLIIDATIQSAPEVDPERQLDALIENLAMPLLQGKVQIILARSYQKYQALGSGKFMGGCTTLIHHKSLTKSANFLNTLSSSTFRNLDEVQFFTHLLTHAADVELDMVKVAASNATFVAEELMPKVPNRSNTHVKGLPFAFKSDVTKWIQRLAVAEMDSFGLVVSSYLDLTFMGALRLNPGQESRERLIEHFYAAGHLWAVDRRYEMMLPFQNVISHIHSILAEVDAGYSGARDEEAFDARMEHMPFTPLDADNQYAAPDPDILVPYYRRRTSEQGGTDLDHVLASYLSLAFRFSRPLKRKPGLNVVEEDPIIQLSDEDRLYLARLCRGLFERGLLECVTPEMSAELSEEWLRLLISLPQRESLEFVFGGISEEQLAGEQASDNIDAYMLSQISAFGRYVPPHKRVKLLSEGGTQWVVALVRRYLQETAPLLGKNPSELPSLLTPSMDRPSKRL